MGQVQLKRVKPSARKNFYLALAAVTVISIAVFAVSEHYNIWDAAYNALCTVSWAHCDQNYSPPAKVVSLLLAFTTWSVLAVVMQSAVDQISRLGAQSMKKRIAGMKSHFIVCGWGNVGRSLCETLAAHNAQFIVVDSDPVVAKKLEEMGIAFIEGDALDPDTLKNAGIDRARLVVGAMGSDADNVFLALTAKDLNPGVHIATRAYTEEAIAKLHRAGAELIVMPEMIAGVELGRELVGLPPGGRELFSRQPTVKRHK